MISKIKSYDFSMTYPKLLNEIPMSLKYIVVEIKKAQDHCDHLEAKFIVDLKGWKTNNTTNCYML